MESGKTATMIHNLRKRGAANHRYSQKRWLRDMPTAGKQQLIDDCTKSSATSACIIQCVDYFRYKHHSNSFTVKKSCSERLLYTNTAGKSREHLHK